MGHTDVATFLVDGAVVQRVGFTTHTHNFAVSIAAELLKLVERAVLDPKKEGKPWLREGKFDWYIFKNGYINSDLLVMTKKKKEKKGQVFWPIQGTPF